MNSVSKQFLTSPMVSDKEYLTPEEAAQLLRISERTMYEMLRAGKVPAQ